MLALTLANIVALREEVTINLHAIHIEEDNIHQQFILPQPNIYIILNSIIEIYRLKDRNAQILDFFDTVDNIQI